jgi:hypothetical protein
MDAETDDDRCAAIRAYRTTPLAALAAAIPTDAGALDGTIAAAARFIHDGVNDPAIAAGSSNCVIRHNDTIAVRVSLAAVASTPSTLHELCWEMTAAAAAYQAGAGVRVLCFGLIALRGAVHFVSVWPWHIPLPTYLSSASERERRAVGASIAHRLANLARTYVHLDATSARNIVLTLDTPPSARIIDFEPRFVRRVVTTQQRAGAARFVGVQLLLLESNTRGGIVPVECVASFALGATPEAISDSACAPLGLFDAAFEAALLQILTLYIGHALRDTLAHRAKRLMELAQETQWATRAVDTGQAGPIIRALVGALFCDTYATHDATPFISDIATALPAIAKRPRTRLGIATEPPLRVVDAQKRRGAREETTRT